MQCRTCRYDLRGQTSPRCPECGTGFEFDNPSTYVGDRRNLVVRNLDHIGGFIARRWWAVGFLLAADLLVAWSVGPNLYHDGIRLVHVFVGADLRALLPAWEIQQIERPGEGGFDLDAAMSACTGSA